MKDRLRDLTIKHYKPRSPRKEVTTGKGKSGKGKRRCSIMEEILETKTRTSEIRISLKVLGEEVIQVVPEKIQKARRRNGTRKR